VGDVVLSRDLGRDGDVVGWWEAVVPAPGGGDGFTLGCGWPEQGLVRRRRADLVQPLPGSPAPNTAGMANTAK
jgi:hypothetical protein